MRDLAFLAAMLFFVPLAFSNTFAAYLLWGWSALIAINEYLYGFMSVVQVNLTFALIALCMITLARDPEKQKLKWTPTGVLLALIGLQAVLSATFAFDGNRQNWELCSTFLKGLLFCIMMPMVVTSRLRIHAVVVMMVLGLSFHGAVEGAKFMASGGGHHVQGLHKFGDNNHFALVLVMIMPMLLYLLQYSTRGIVKLGLLCGLALNIAGVIGTSSRGGLVAMVLAGAWVVFSGRRKIMGLWVLLAGTVLVVALAPESWSDRMHTIQEADQDSSFMGRVVAWKISSAIALDNPVFGGGFHAVEVAPVWTKYRDSQGFLGFVETPTPDIAPHAAHSIYFEIAGDLGFVGLALFLSILINTFLVRREVRRRAKLAGPAWLWASDLADGLSASMFAYVVGAAALSVGYLEIMYMFAMLLEVLKQHVITGTTST